MSWGDWLTVFETVSKIWHRKRDAWTRSSWGSWHTSFLKSLKCLTKFAAIVHTSPHEVPDRYCFWSVWKTCIFWRGWGGKGQQERGCGDTSPMSWASWVTLVLLKPWKIWVCCPAKLGSKYHGQKRFWMFLEGSVLQTFDKHGLAGCFGEGKGQNHNNKREDIMNVKSQRAGWSTGKIMKGNLSEQLHSSQIH